MIFRFGEIDLSAVLILTTRIYEEARVRAPMPAEIVTERSLSWISLYQARDA